MTVFFSIILILFCFGTISKMGIWGVMLLIGVIVIGVALSNKSEKEKIQSEKKKTELRNKIRESIMSQLYASFRKTKEIKRDFSSTEIYIDEPRRKIMFLEFEPLGKVIYSFNDVVECTIMENGSTIQSGGVSRAIVGGVVAGGAGAIVGATTAKSKPVTFSLSVRIITSNIQNPLYEIKLITSETDQSSIDYKRNIEFAQEIYATIVSVTNYSKNLRRF